MRSLTIEPQNPLDLRPGDVAPLVADLRERLTDFNVELSPGTLMPAGARGVTWWEVVHVYLPEIAGDARGAVIAIILEAAYKWAQERFRRKREHGVDKRPKCVVIHRVDRVEETSVVLLSPRHKPKTAEEARLPARAARGKKTRSGAARRRKSAATRRRKKPK